VLGRVRAYGPALSGAYNSNKLIEPTQKHCPAILSPHYSYIVIVRAKTTLVLMMKSTLPFNTLRWQVFVFLKLFVASTTLYQLLILTSNSIWKYHCNASLNCENGLLFMSQACCTLFTVRVMLTWLAQETSSCPWSCHQGRERGSWGIAPFTLKFNFALQPLCRSERTPAATEQDLQETSGFGKEKNL
jgi:hypothetical protein